MSYRRRATETPQATKSPYPELRSHTPSERFQGNIEPVSPGQLPNLVALPLDRVYPVIFIDCVNVKIREGNVANRPIYVALAVTVDGHRDILGLWAGEHGDGEGAKYS